MDKQQADQAGTQAAPQAGAQAGTQNAPGQQGGQGSVAQQGGGAQSAVEASKRQTGVLMPPVDVVEDASGITLLADMPGVSRDQLNLRLEAHRLTIEGDLSIDVPQDMQSRYAEVRAQHYERSFALSRDLDGEQATAELSNGVLKVRIPKSQQAVPRKIPVNVVTH